MPKLTPAQITALDTYVAAPDSSYSFSLNSTITGTGYTDYVINMISQTWTPSPGDSEVWQHWLQIIVPSNVNTQTALLNISGGTNSASPPTSPDPTTLTAATTLDAIAVFLPTVPNEPVTFPAQGETAPLTEDQIVAYTFEQFLDGNGQDWPLLLPMVKSAVRAMDTTQTFVSSESGGALSVDNFIVTGASKRGWTTWLTPAVDTRVVAVVPFVFDGLNLPEQIESQLDTYVGVTQDTVNGDSTAVEDYTNDGVFNFFGTPQMTALDSIVDPFSYIDRSTYDIPKYLVDSTGDQFFVPDAQFFFSDLPGQNYLRYVPNTDHGLDGDAVTGAINFEKAFLDGAALPQFSWNVTDGGTTITLNSITTPASVTMWQATNTTNRDFRLETFGANWTSSTLTDQGGGTYVAQVTPPATGATDFFIQMQYTVDGVTLTFTTQISTVPLLTPTIAASGASGTFTGNPYTATATATGLAGLPVPGTFSFSYYTGNGTSGPALLGAPTSPGIYTAVASFTSSDPDYANGRSSPVHFQIFKAAPVITLSDSGRTFDGNPSPATATIAGIVAGVDNTPGNSLEGVPLTVEYFPGVNSTGPPLPGPPTTAGEYEASAGFAGSQDYTSFGRVYVFEISQAVPTITVTAPSGPYNGSPFQGSATIAGVVAGVDNTPGSTLEGVGLTLTYFSGGLFNGTPIPGPPTAPGTYAVTASFAGSTDYEQHGNAVAFVISPATPVITLTDMGGPFNDTPYPATATIAGVVAGVDNTPGSSLEGVPLIVSYFSGSTATGTPLSGAPIIAGQYTALASFAGSTDYEGVSQSLPFVITPNAAPVIVSAGATSPVVASGTPPTYTSGTPPYVNYSTANPVGWAGSTTAVDLNAIATDDGLPNPPDTLTSTWSYSYTPYGQSSPTGTGTFGSQTLATPPDSGQLYFNTPATFTQPGVYDVTLTISDGQLQTVEPDFTIYVNAPPVIVSAGATSPVVASGTPATYTTGTPPYVTYSSANPVAWAGSTTAVDLNAIATDDGLPNPPDQLTATWSYTFTASGQSSPVTGTFGSQTQATPANNGQLYFNTPATFTQPGVYDVTLTISDGQLKTVEPDFKIYVGQPFSITAPATASVVENASLVFSSAGGNPITISDSNAGTSTEQLTLTVTKGTLSLAMTNGITVTSGANNSPSMTLHGTLAALDAALNGLQFTPTTGFTGSVSLAISFKDLGSSQTASASVAITVVAPPVTAFVSVFLPIAVPGEPVPLIIGAIDTNLAAQFAPFKINISFGDGNTANVTSHVPLLVNHIYKKVGVYTVSVTATDEFGRTSAPATVVIRVVSLFFGINPFNPGQTVLYVGEMPGDTVSFSTAPDGGIAVTLDGVSQGVFNPTGPVVLLGQQLPTKPILSMNQMSGISIQTPTTAALESELDSEALQWAGLSAATEILNE